jgi:electron transport complex protein RnfG
MKWLVSVGLGGAVLALFAAITSLAIGWTYLGTQSQIELAIRRAEARQLMEIFPAGTHDNDVVDDTFALEAETALLGLRQNRQGVPRAGRASRYRCHFACHRAGWLQR